MTRRTLTDADRWAMVNAPVNEGTDLIRSADVAATHQLNVYGQCGAFELPVAPVAPTQAQALPLSAQSLPA